MRLRSMLVYSAEKNHELRRISEECARIGIKCRICTPQAIVNFRLKDFDAILFRQIRGHSKHAIRVAKRAGSLGLVVVDEKLSKGLDRSKLDNYLLFRRAGLFVPKTLELSKKNLRRIRLFHGNKVVVKPVFGKRGESVRLLEKNNSKALLRFASRSGKHMVQEFVPIKRELRVMVVGKRVIGGIAKQAKSWVRNFYTGAKPKKSRLSGKIRSACLKAASIVGTEIAGVDIAVTKHGLFVLEANRSPGFAVFEKCTGKNVAEAILSYVASKCSNAQRA